jgi:GT2 family glycosyltransferase
MTSETPGTISIVSHGHGELLRALLRDLEAQADIGQWLVLVTLNIPEDFDPGAYPGLRIRVIGNAVPKGFGANHNAANQQAEGPLLLIVNPDIRMTASDSLARIAADADARHAPALRAPVVVNSSGAREDSVRGNMTPWSLFVRVIGRRRGVPAVRTPANESGRFFWIAGMFLIVDRRVFADLGGFDERFFMYCEDYDLCARMVNSGHRIAVLPDVVVIHDAQRASHRSWKHLRWHLAGLMKVWTSRTYWKRVMDR